MSVERLILKLENLVRTSPTLAHVPFAVVDGQPITPAEALQRIRSGDYSLATKLIQQGIDPPQDELTILAKDFYRRVASADPTLRLYFLGVVPSSIPLAQAVEEIEKGTDLGKELVDIYKNLLYLTRGRLVG